MTCIHIQNGKPTGDHRVYFCMKRRWGPDQSCSDTANTSLDQTSRQYGFALVRRKVVGSVMRTALLPPSDRRVQYW